jgi:hypothetical protein
MRAGRNPHRRERSPMDPWRWAAAAPAVESLQNCHQNSRRGSFKSPRNRRPWCAPAEASLFRMPVRASKLRVLSYSRSNLLPTDVLQESRRARKERFLMRVQDPGLSSKELKMIATVFSGGYANN